MSGEGQHDHDEELGMYWYAAGQVQQPDHSPHRDPLPNTDVPPNARRPPRTKSDKEARDVNRLIGESTRTERARNVEKAVPPSQPAPVLEPRVRDQAYWDETVRLIMDYFELQAGAHFSETLFDGFIAWLKNSSDSLKQFENGDDMTRAALVDWYLRLVR